MECRTGKTITALETARKYGATSVLFLSKIKAIPSIKSDYKALNPSYSIEAANYESAHKLTGCYDFVILDEAHCLGAYPKPSKRTEQVKRLCQGLPVLYLSGTPTPESYSQIFYQLWTCDFSPFREYPNFYKWARDYVRVTTKRVNGFTINDYSHANEGKVKQAIKDIFITDSQEDAGFKCNIDEEDLICSMNFKTEALIKHLKRSRVVEFDDCIILGDTAVKLMLKLHQLSSGTVITEEGERLIIDDSKAQKIKETFKGQKIAIFYVYQSERDLLCRIFPNWTESPEEFQQSEDKVFISQVRKAREGVRLDTAEAIIFYDLEYSYLSYEQGRNRILSKERQTPAKVYFQLWNR